jgi:hypothetical protein
LIEINQCSNEEIPPIHQDLEEAIAHFESIQVLGSISEERRQISALMQRNSQIMELLEIPQLFDTFIRNGYYEEAMDLKVKVKGFMLGSCFTAINSVSSC